MKTKGSKRWTYLRFAVSAILIGLLALTVILPSHELPFHLHIRTDSGVVEPRTGMPLPRGLHPGDVVPLAAQGVRMRAVLLNGNVPDDASYLLRVERGDGLKSVAVRSVPLSRTPTFYPNALITLVLTGMILALGLLVLWRGRGWEAWGIAVFFLSSSLSDSLMSFSAPPYANLMLLGTETLLTGVIFVGLFLMAHALVGWRPGQKLAWKWLYGFLLSCFVAARVGEIAGFLFTGMGNPPIAIQVGTFLLGLLCLAVPILILAHGYYRASPEARLRIRWILLGTSLLIPLFISYAFWHTSSLWVALGRLFLTLSLIAFYTYAILRRRLVEVRVVVNRVLVFATLMAGVVGFFALIENLIERSAIGEGAGIAFEIVIPLILGVLFHQLHRRIEAFVDRVFFQREHRARAELNRFVHDAAFIQSPAVLLERTVETFGRAVGATGCALYEIHPQGYRLSARDDAARRLPVLLDPDDRALVRLRATRNVQDLHSLGSALGEEGLALPLALRGQLFGVLFLGPLPAGRYAKADIERLAHAAHEVGASLFALRAQAADQLIEALASGRLEPGQARDWAIRLADGRVLQPA